APANGVVMAWGLGSGLDSGLCRSPSTLALPPQSAQYFAEPIVESKTLPRESRPSGDSCPIDPSSLLGKTAPTTIFETCALFSTLASSPFLHFQLVRDQVLHASVDLVSSRLGFCFFRRRHYKRK